MFASVQDSFSLVPQWNLCSTGVVQVGRQSTSSVETLKELSPNHGYSPSASSFQTRHQDVCGQGHSSITTPVPTSRMLRGTVVERRSLAGELSLSYARPVADG